MNPKNLDTYCQNTWCPGCPNFAILESVKRAISELIEKEYQEKILFLLAELVATPKFLII